MSKENITQMNPTPKEPPSPAAPAGPKVHALSDQEKALLQGLNIMVLNAKGKIHDLNVDLEKSQRDLQTAMSSLHAALSMVGASNDISSPTIAANFEKITGMGS